MIIKIGDSIEYQAVTEQLVIISPQYSTHVNE